VKFIRGVDAGELSQMEMRKRKIFRVARVDRLFALRRRKKFAGAAECNGRKTGEEGEETEREYESGQELLRQRVYEVPEDRMPSKRGKECTSLVFERRKALSCCM